MVSVAMTGDMGHVSQTSRPHDVAQDDGTAVAFVAGEVGRRKRPAEPACAPRTTVKRVAEAKKCGGLMRGDVADEAAVVDVMTPVTPAAAAIPEPDGQENGAASAWRSRLRGGLSGWGRAVRRW
jgi:hypothetical protein